MSSLSRSKKTNMFKSNNSHIKQKSINGFINGRFKTLDAPPFIASNVGNSLFHPSHKEPNRENNSGNNLQKKFSNTETKPSPSAYIKTLSNADNDIFTKRVTRNEDFKIQSHVKETLEKEAIIYINQQTKAESIAEECTNSLFPSKLITIPEIQNQIGKTFDDPLDVTKKLKVWWAGYPIVLPSLIIAIEKNLVCSDNIFVCVPLDTTKKDVVSPSFDKWRFFFRIQESKFEEIEKPLLLQIKPPAMRSNRLENNIIHRGDFLLPNLNFRRKKINVDNLKMEVSFGQTFEMEEKQEETTKKEINIDKKSNKIDIFRSQKIAIDICRKKKTNEKKENEINILEKKKILVGEKKKQESNFFFKQVDTNKKLKDNISNTNSQMETATEEYEDAQGEEIIEEGEEEVLEEDYEEGGSDVVEETTTEGTNNAMEEEEEEGEEVLKEIAEEDVIDEKTKMNIDEFASVPLRRISRRPDEVVSSKKRENNKSIEPSSKKRENNKSIEPSLDEEINKIEETKVQRKQESKPQPNPQSASNKKAQITTMNRSKAPQSIKKNYDRKRVESVYVSHSAVEERGGKEEEEEDGEESDGEYEGEEEEGEYEGEEGEESGWMQEGEEEEEEVMSEGEGERSQREIEDIRLAEEVAKIVSNKLEIPNPVKSSLPPSKRSSIPQKKTNLTPIEKKTQPNTQKIGLSRQNPPTKITPIQEERHNVGSLQNIDTNPAKKMKLPNLKNQMPDSQPRADSKYVPNKSEEKKAIQKTKTPALSKKSESVKESVEENGDTAEQSKNKKRKASSQEESKNLSKADKISFIHSYLATACAGRADKIRKQMAEGTYKPVALPFSPLLDSTGRELDIETNEDIILKSLGILRHGFWGDELRARAVPNPFIACKTQSALEEIFKTPEFKTAARIMVAYCHNELRLDNPDRQKKNEVIDTSGEDPFI